MTDDTWYSDQLGSSRRFRYNQSVRIIAGDHIGATGALISVEAMEPEPVYLVELASGLGDVLIPESRLAAME